MNLNQRDRLFQRALTSYRAGSFVESARDLRSLIHDGSSDPRHISYCGLAIARAEGRFKDGLALCERATIQGCYDAEMYLNLAQLHLYHKDRRRAVEVLIQGVRVAPKDLRLHRELRRMSPRARPVLPFLARGNRLNRYLGLTRARLSRYVNGGH